MEGSGSGTVNILDLDKEGKRLTSVCAFLDLLSLVRESEKARDERSLAMFNSIDGNVIGGDVDSPSSCSSLSFYLS